MPESARHFLDVERSETGRAWTDRIDDGTARLAAAMTQRSAVSDILARIMAARGIAVEETDAYLLPTVRGLMPDPSTLTGMDALTDRLARAIAASEKIALFGDYDVDGACSCALTVRYLRHFGIDPAVYIPDRIFEGYGPNVGAMDRLIDGGATLIVTLDCGTVSTGPIAHARGRGVDVLVIDHHLSEGPLPDAVAVVNPNRPDDLSGLTYLCAAGVTFMALVAANRALREGGRRDLPDLMALLDLVALATICDVVPLVGLNRAFVARGLDVARSGRNRGLATLVLAAGIGGPVNPYHLGFVVGPRINAGGRIGDASLGARLLALDDDREAAVIAYQLSELNAERQRIEVAAVEEACRAAESEIGGGEGPPVLVLASADWHQGVVGLVAARLRERFDRPAFAFALAPDGSGTGSGRSLPGVDLGRAVIDAVDAGIISRGGGHAMAAGASILPGQLGPFRSHLATALGDKVRAARAATDLKVDAALTARGANPSLLRDVERAGPFGSGNPQPVFAFPSHRIKFAEVVGAGGHVRFTLAADDGARLRAIAFRAAETALGQALLGMASDRPVHVAGSLVAENWQGRDDVQLRAVDVAVPSRG